MMTLVLFNLWILLKFRIRPFFPHLIDIALNSYELFVIISTKILVLSKNIGRERSVLFKTIAILNIFEQKSKQCINLLHSNDFFQDMIHLWQKFDIFDPIVLQIEFA